MEKSYFNILVWAVIISLSLSMVRGCRIVTLEKEFATQQAELRTLRQKTEALERIAKAQAEKLGRVILIDKDSIGIGYRGELYSKYHRKYKITER